MVVIVQLGNKCKKDLSNTVYEEKHNLYIQYNIILLFYCFHVYFKLYLKCVFV